MIPEFQSLKLPISKLVGDGEEHSTPEAVDRFAVKFEITAEEWK